MKYPLEPQQELLFTAKGFTNFAGNPNGYCTCTGENYKRNGIHTLRLRYGQHNEISRINLNGNAVCSCHTGHASNSTSEHSVCIELFISNRLHVLHNDRLNENSVMLLYLPARQWEYIGKAA